MDGAAGRVPFEVREVQHLRHDALPGERRVAVDEDRKYLAPLRVARLRGTLPVQGAILLGANPPLDHRVDDLQMARVEGQRQVHAPAVGQRPVAGVSEVVLHVAPAHHRLDLRVLELGEQLAQPLAEHVDEDVEAAAVGHAEDDLFSALPPELLHQPVQQRDQALRALEREALLADVLAVEEGLQRLGVREPREDAQLLFAREGRRVLRCLHALLQPPLDGRILAVHVLDADGAAVGPLEVGEDLAQGHLALAGGEVAGGERLVELLFGEAEVLDLELGRGRLEQPERVEIREEVAADAVGVDQLSDLLLQDLRLQPLLSGRGDR